MTKDADKTVSNELDQTTQPQKENEGSTSLSPENVEPATPTQSQQTTSPRAILNPRRLDPTISVAVIRAVPKIFGLIIFLSIMLLYQDTIKEMVPRTSGVEAFGFKISLSALVEKESRRNMEKSINQKELKSAYSRAWNEKSAFKNAHILWVDDHPENNAILERPMLTSLGAQITVALSNKEAGDFLRRADYDLVITDMSRDVPSETGAEILKIVSESIQAFPPPVIYYTMKRYSVSGAFATTTTPDRLLNYVTEALERQEWRKKTQTGEMK